MGSADTKGMSGAGQDADDPMRLEIQQGIPMREAQAHLARADPVMRKLIKACGPCALKKHHDYFMLLCRAIIAQQISNAAARSIAKRFQALYDGKPTPEKVLRTRDLTLRKAGISPQKLGYLKSLAQHFHDNTITPRRFSRMSDEAIIEELVKVKGIGRWTAEMFLIFSLNRPDVFAYDDLGLRNAICRLYFDGNEIGKDRLLALTRRWAPYRSVASWYLWDAMDTLPPDERGW